MLKILGQFGWFYALANIIAAVLFFGLEPLWKFLLNV